MLIKAGVQWREVKTPIRKARKKAEKVFRNNGEPDLIITSALEGTHQTDSQHYPGYADDWRGPMMFPENFDKIGVELSIALGKGYRVIPYPKTGRFGIYHAQWEDHL